jgi:hypothetical protein
MTNPLAEVRRVAKAKRRADERYRAALVRAVDELGEYALVAEAAGVSRQAVRQLVQRERTRPPS